MPAAGAPSINFDHISLHYEGKPLFQNISLEIPGGECTCILGPSGCGKSTLLRLITGGETPADGLVTINGKPPAARTTAWMSQNDLLLPWLCLLDNILLGAKLRKEETPELHEQAKHLIRAAGLAGYEKALPGTLSGGMRQRGALLRTLMEKRQVVLMDEPFSALDALTRFTLQRLCAELLHKVTVVLVTHDPMEALRMGNTIIVLSRPPATVKMILTLATAPPRNPDDQEVQHNLAPLMTKLMKET
ncbi:MAG: ABC transporter ATP-binding protein [Desulfobulbus propionicus]|nr:MAG: ABC transporter ATP-binding protein [Desulfobulbus propionicus]